MQLPLITILLVVLTALTGSVRSCSFPQRHRVATSHPPQALGNSSLVHHPGDELLKRWYGVKPLNPAPISPGYHPWPATCEGVQPVRYCFKDKRSIKLRPLIALATAKWAQAMQPKTALTFALDPTCRENPENLCSHLDVAKDALMISDVTKDDDDEWNKGPDCVTESTLGYMYIPKGQPDMLYRHYLKVCPTGNDDDTIRQLTHTIGHVIGLQHEHQRPDRNQYISFQCQNLQGYDEAYQKVSGEHEGWFESNLSMDEKMFRVCNHELYAQKFLPSALEYIRYDVDHMKTPSGWIMVNSMEAPADFDDRSIMIYDADHMSKDKAGKKYVLLKRGANGEVGDPVWMGDGANSDPASTHISLGDIARVAILYDNGSENAKRAQQGLNQGAVRVKIRDILDIIVPAPRKRDEL